MSILKKEPLAVLTLIVTLVLGFVNNEAFMSLFRGQLIATIASSETSDKQCIDREILIINKSDTVAKNIRVNLEFDFITRRGDVEILYGNALHMLIPSGQSLLIESGPMSTVPYSYNSKDAVIQVPKLSPNEYIHLHYGGYENINSTSGKAREKNIRNGDEQFIDKPKVASVLFDSGVAKIERATKSNCRI